MTELEGRQYVDVEDFDEAVEALRARLAEATKLIERCEKHARFPLPSDDPLLYQSIREFLGPTYRRRALANRMKRSVRTKG